MGFVIFELDRQRQCSQIVLTEYEVTANVQIQSTTLSTVHHVCNNHSGQELARNAAALIELIYTVQCPTVHITQKNLIFSL